MTVSPPPTGRPSRARGGDCKWRGGGGGGKGMHKGLDGDKIFALSLDYHYGPLEVFLVTTPHAEIGHTPNLEWL